MRDLKLKLSGMGILIKADARVIKKALESIGYVVEIDDNEEDVDWFGSSDEYKPDNKKITLTLNHEPWGG